MAKDRSKNFEFEKELSKIRESMQKKAAEEEAKIETGAREIREEMDDLVKTKEDLQEDLKEIEERKTKIHELQKEAKAGPEEKKRLGELFQKLTKEEQEKTTQLDKIQKDLGKGGEPSKWISGVKPELKKKIEEHYSPENLKKLVLDSLTGDQKAIQEVLRIQKGGPHLKEVQPVLVEEMDKVYQEMKKEYESKYEKINQAFGLDEIKDGLAQLDVKWPEAEHLQLSRFLEGPWPKDYPFILQGIFTRTGEREYGKGRTKNEKNLDLVREKKKWFLKWQETWWKYKNRYDQLALKLDKKGMVAKLFGGEKDLLTFKDFFSKVQRETKDVYLSDLRLGEMEGRERKLNKSIEEMRPRFEARLKNALDFLQQKITLCENLERKMEVLTRNRWDSQQFVELGYSINDLESKSRGFYNLGRLKSGEQPSYQPRW